jgi:hypothetical protein
MWHPPDPGKVREIYPVSKGHREKSDLQRLQRLQDRLQQDDKSKMWIFIPMEIH